MAMWTGGSIWVECVRRCDVMNRFGGVDADGIASRRVVEVPSDNMASPGVKSPATVVELSSVNGATIQSNNAL